MVLTLLLGCSGPAETDSVVVVDDATPALLSTTPCEACGGDCVIEELAYPARYHATAPVDYVDLPPAGGPHDRCWADWGVATALVDDDNFVHNLEHGGVALLWNCSPDCPDERAAIEAFVASHERTLATSYPAMPSRFAVVAWGARLTASCLDVPEIEAFYVARFDRGPESTGSLPPSGCTTDTDP